MVAPMEASHDIDLHCLELRYAGARLIDARAVERLARSIEQCGQLIPCIVVADGGRLVVIDGYRRIAALRRLGRDTASVEQWTCDLAQALLNVLARSRSRPFAAVEEALLLRELVSRLQLSQREIAKRNGRDVSWVQRRLQLLVALPDPLLDAIRARQLSTWAACRIFAPLARANTDHAQRLLTAVQSTPLSTRELKRWFEHYRGAQHPLRERLVSHPRLFVDVLASRDEHQASKRLGAGPEGFALTDLRRLEGFLRHLRKQLAVLTDPVPEPVTVACVRVATAWRAVDCELTRLVHHDSDRDASCRPDPPGAGSERARDQPPAQALA
jgi:ParB family transcriptional regulator, chromosome partitioning protein